MRGGSMQEGTVLSVISKAINNNNSYHEMTERTVPSCIQYLQNGLTPAMH